MLNLLTMESGDFSGRGKYRGPAPVILLRIKDTPEPSVSEPAGYVRKVRRKPKVSKDSGVPGGYTGASPEQARYQKKRGEIMHRMKGPGGPGSASADHGLTMAVRTHPFSNRDGFCAFGT